MDIGTPMGRLANIPSHRFKEGVEKARLWLNSWIARKRLWLRKDPKKYETARIFSHPESWREIAVQSWRRTTNVICRTQLGRKENA